MRPTAQNRPTRGQAKPPSVVDPAPDLARSRRNTPRLGRPLRPRGPFPQGGRNQTPNFVGLAQRLSRSCSTYARTKNTLVEPPQKWPTSTRLEAFLIWPKRVPKWSTKTQVETGPDLLTRSKLGRDGRKLGLHLKQCNSPAINSANTNLNLAGPARISSTSPPTPTKPTKPS